MCWKVTSGISVEIEETACDAVIDWEGKLIIGELVCGFIIWVLSVNVPALKPVDLVITWIKTESSSNELVDFTDVVILSFF